MKQTINAAMAREVLAGKYFQRKDGVGDDIHRVHDGMPVYYNDTSCKWMVSSLLFVWGHDDCEIDIEIIRPDSVSNEVKSAEVDLGKYDKENELIRIENISVSGDSNFADKCQELNIEIGEYCVIEDGVGLMEESKIGDYCKLKEGTIIGPHSIVGDYCIIEGSNLHEYVQLQGFNRIGNGCVLHNNVVMKYQAILTSHATLHERVFIGVQAVTLGSDANGHQVQGTEIGAGSYIGGHGIVAPGLKVPEGVVLGANSFLKKVEGPGTYVGNPAKLKK